MCTRSYKGQFLYHIKKQLKNIKSNYTKKIAKSSPKKNTKSSPKKITKNSPKKIQTFRLEKSDNCTDYLINEISFSILRQG